MLRQHMAPQKTYLPNPTFCCLQRMDIHQERSLPLAYPLLYTIHLEIVVLQSRRTEAWLHDLLLHAGRPTSSADRCMRRKNREGHVQGTLLRAAPSVKKA